MENNNTFNLAQVAKKNGAPVKHYVVLTHEMWTKIQAGFKTRYGLQLETPTQLADVLMRTALADLKIVATPKQ